MTTSSDTRPRITLPNADVFRYGDDALKTTHRAWKTAAAEFVAASQRFAAAMARQLWPAAEALVFDIVESLEGGIDATLMLVYDDADRLLWFNPDRIDPADLTMFVDANADTLNPAALDDDTADVIENAIEGSIAADFDSLPPFMHDVTGQDWSDPRLMFVSIAADEYRPAPERITFDQLADALTRETSGIIQVEEIPGFIDGIRILIAATATDTDA